MKFTLSWLKDHLDTEASVEEISTKLSAIGLEVEGVSNPAEALSAFVVARVLEAKQHPNADKLRVCQVDIGQGPIEVVCGAPNARTGMIGVFAPTGTYIPGTGVTLEAKPVRGIVSNGMLCSERELMLSDDHDGIIDLPAEMADRIGTRYVAAMGLDDPVFEIKITPNRPDALGVRGIARDLAAAGLGTLRKEDTGYAKAGDYDCPVEIAVDFPPGAGSACPAFAGRFVRGVRNGPSPAWLQQRLKAIGLRPINALVDVTNYITFDRGRPLHVYDADRLHGTIRARLAMPGERFMALDNKEYEADGEMTVIADDAAVLGFGGIMGGRTTGCSEETVNVLIESAYFDPVRTATTGRRTGIRSDARYRFERGVDPQSLPLGINLATKLILELCGGVPSRTRIAGEAPSPQTAITLRASHVERLAGLAVKEAEQKRILKTLGFAVDGKGEEMTVKVPSFRPDIHGAADLVEEIVRIVGIEKVPATAMPRVTGVARATLTEPQKRVRRVRRTLAGRGMVEAITWSFITRDAAVAFGGGQDELELANPISSEMTSMRPSLLPGLLAALQRNLDRGLGDHALFEIGQAYRGDQPTDQVMLAAGVRTRLARPMGAGRSWQERSEPAGPFDVKADVAAALSAVGLDPNRLQLTRDAPAWFHPGRSGTIRLGPKIALAAFGEMHPRVTTAHGIDGRVLAFEIVLDQVPPAKRRPTKARPPLDASDLQPLRRDFAFLVASTVSAGDVVRAAEGVDRKLVTGVSVFDLFEGGSLAAGSKSLAIEVTLQPREKTLTDEEIEAVSQRIIAAVKKATGGEVRS